MANSGGMVNKLKGVVLVLSMSLTYAWLDLYYGTLFSEPICERGSGYLSSPLDTFCCTLKKEITAFLQVTVPPPPPPVPKNRLMAESVYGGDIQSISTDHCSQEPPCARTAPWFRGRILAPLFFYHRVGFFMVLVDAGQLFRCARRHFMCCVAAGPPIRGDPISQSQVHIPLKPLPTALDPFPEATSP